MKTPILAFDDVSSRYSAADISFTSVGTDGTYSVSWALSTVTDPETELKERSIALISPGTLFRAEAGIEKVLEDGAKFTPTGPALVHGIRVDALDALVQHYAKLGRKCPSWLVFDGVDTAQLEAALPTTVVDSDLAELLYPESVSPEVDWCDDFNAGTGRAIEVLDDTRTAGEAPGTTTRQITLRAFHVEGEGTEAVTVNDDVAEFIVALGEVDPTLADTPPVVAARNELQKATTFHLYLSFKRWKPETEAEFKTTHSKGRYESLPEDTVVRVIDDSGPVASYLALTGTIGNDGLVHWRRAVGGPYLPTDFVVNMLDFTSSVYFLVLGLPSDWEFRYHDDVVKATSSTGDTTHQAFSWTDGIVAPSVTLSNCWGTKGMWTMGGDRTGTFDGLNILTATAIGRQATPVTFTVGIPVHAKFTYSQGEVESDQFVGTCPMPPGIPVRIVVGGASPTTLATFYTDKQGQIDGTVNTWTDGDAGLEFAVDLSIRDDNTGLKPLNLSLQLDAAPMEGVPEILTSISHLYVSNDAVDLDAGLGPWSGGTRRALAKAGIGTVGTPIRIQIGAREIAPTAADLKLQKHRLNIACGCIHMLRISRATYNWFEAVTEPIDDESPARLSTVMGTNLYDVDVAHRVTFDLWLGPAERLGVFGGTNYNRGAKSLRLTLFHSPPPLPIGGFPSNTCWSSETISHEMTHALVEVAFGTTRYDASATSTHQKFHAIFGAELLDRRYDGQCLATSEYTALLEGLSTFAEGPFGGKLKWESSLDEALRATDTPAAEAAAKAIWVASRPSAGQHQTPQGVGMPVRGSVLIEDFKYRLNLTDGDVSGAWFYPISGSLTTHNKWIVAEGINTRDRASRTGLSGIPQRWIYYHSLREITSGHHYDLHPGQLNIMVIGSFLWLVLRNKRPDDDAAAVSGVIRDFDAPGEPLDGDRSPYFDEDGPVFRVFKDTGATTEDWDVTQFLDSGDKVRGRRLFQQIFWIPLMHLATPANWQAVQHDYTQPFVKRWWKGQAQINALDPSGGHHFWPSSKVFFDELVADYNSLSESLSEPTAVVDRARVMKWLNFMLLHRNTPAP